MRVDTMVTRKGTETRLHGIDGKWMTGADLLDLARRIHQLQIDGQRLANEPARHPATPSYLEYQDPPAYDEACNLDPSSMRAKEKIDE